MLDGEDSQELGFPRYTRPDGSFSLVYSFTDRMMGWHSEGRDHPDIWQVEIEADPHLLPLVPPAAGWMVGEEAPWPAVSVSNTSLCPLLPWWTVAVLATAGVAVLVVAVGCIGVKKCRSTGGGAEVPAAEEARELTEQTERMEDN